MTGHTAWPEVKQYKKDMNELGPRVARAIRIESHARRSAQRGDLMALLIAKRIRARSIKETSGQLET